MYVIGNAIRGNVIVTTATNDPAVDAGTNAGRLIQTLPDGGDAGEIAISGSGAKDPNDVVANKDGTVFFTDPLYQSGGTTTGVYKVVGTAVSVVKGYSTANTPEEHPDGIALSPDEKTLYVGFGAAQRVDRFTIDATGNTTQVNGNFIAMSDFGDLLPEGMATDVGGNLWITANPEDPNTNGGAVLVFAPDGKKYGEIRFPNHRPTGIAFGGSDNKTLYVVANQAQLTPGEFNGYVFIYSSRCAGVR